jgi:hypothetical protein
MGGWNILAMACYIDIFMVSCHISPHLPDKYTIAEDSIENGYGIILRERLY